MARFEHFKTVYNQNCSGHTENYLLALVGAGSRCGGSLNGGVWWLDAVRCKADEPMAEKDLVLSKQCVTKTIAADGMKNLFFKLFA